MQKSDQRKEPISPKPRRNLPLEESYNTREQELSPSKQSIAKSSTSRMSFFKNRKLKQKFNTLKQSNNNFILKEIEIKRKQVIIDYQTHLQRAKNPSQLHSESTTALPRSLHSEIEEDSLGKTKRESVVRWEVTSSADRVMSMRGGPQIIQQLKLTDNFSGFDEKDLVNLLNQRVVFSKQDRKFLIKYVVKGIPDKLRGKFWLVCTGVSSYMQDYCQSYYKNLSEKFVDYPNPNYKQIKLDLQRTFPSDPYYRSKEVQDSIERILIAYINRNPTIGYCQGMNFIVGRLRKFLSEEETFWVFSIIIESYLPFDYFAMMVGVLIDQKIFMKFVECDFKQLHQKFQKLGFDPSILAFQWFVCIFTYNMPEQTALQILDLFLVQGCKALFSIGITLVSILSDQILECEDISDMFQVLESSNTIFNLSRKILELSQKYHKISNSTVVRMRKKYREEAFAELQEYEQKRIMQDQEKDRAMSCLPSFKSQKNALNLKRMKFLNKFHLFQSSNKMSSIVNQSLQNPDSFFHCDHEQWPLCIFDFTYRNILPQFFAFKAKNETYTIMDQYFYGEERSTVNNRSNRQEELKEEEGLMDFGISQQTQPCNNLVVERNKHLCRNQEFKRKFIQMYLNCNDELLNCKFLNQNLTTSLSADYRLRQFQQFVLKADDTVPLNALLENSIHQEERGVFTMQIQEMTEAEVTKINDESKLLDTSGILDQSQLHDEKDDYQEWINSFYQNNEMSVYKYQRQRSTVEISPIPSLFDKQKQNRQTKIEATFGEEMFRIDKRTSVGGLIRQKTLVAFKHRQSGVDINEKQAKALKESSIMAFNNNFL